MDTGGQPVTGGAQRHKQRRLRSWWRHEQSIAAALATITRCTTRRSSGRILLSRRQSQCTLLMCLPLVGSRPDWLISASCPQERVLRRTVEQLVDYVPVFPLLDAPVPQMVDQSVDVLKIFDTLLLVLAEQVIEVPKITAPRFASREVLLRRRRIEHSSFRPKRFCRHFMAGPCEDVWSCTFAHGEQELTLPHFVAQADCGRASAAMGSDMNTRECLIEEEPLLLVGSTHCAAFSQLQNLSRDSERWWALAREGMQHLTFVCELYKKQIDGERFFLHEHPAHARSWSLWMIREFLDMPGIVRVVGDQCPFGLWCTGVEGLALVRKPTGWMTNSMKVAKKKKHWTADALEGIDIATSSVVVRTRCVSLSVTPFVL